MDKVISVTSQSKENKIQKFPKNVCEMQNLVELKIILKTKAKFEDIPQFQVWDKCSSLQRHCIVAKAQILK